MESKKILTPLFYVFLLLNLLLMADITMLGVGIVSGNVNSILTSARWDAYQPMSGEVVLNIDADLPPSGIIPKKLLFELQLQYVEDGSYSEPTKQSVAFGQNKQIELRITLSPVLQFRLDLGGTVVVNPILTIYFQIFDTTLPSTGRILELSQYEISY